MSITMRAINLDTYSLSLLTAKEDILNARASTNWALFAYDGVTNNLKLSDSGAGGLTELVQKFHSAKPMYGLCRVGLTDLGQPRIAMICWVGDSVDEIRKTECESHVPAVKNFFREAHVFISASSLDEVAEEKVGEILAKVRPTTERLRRNSRPTEKEETVGTNYRKTNAAMEMKRINRDSFWARAEREEEQRKEEERRKAAEERRRLERERIMQERKEADERDRKMNEKLQMIEEQKKAEAKIEEEARRKEKARWDLQQREHEEEMRARLRRSESIEKAAEAAVLVSQRSINPREFFRQLSSSSQNSTSPMSPRSGKPPFRRYQRSLTDTAFIFERASATSGSASPLSPSFSSPFSRTPTSPFNRPMSPTSPTFRPVTSPPCPRTPVRSPPTSPAHRPSPPVSSLPSPPASRPPPPQSSPPSLPPVSQAQIQASAPPVSPDLRDSLAERELSSPGGNRQKVIPDAPTAPLPESPAQYMEPVTSITSTRMLSELQTEMDFTVKAVLVEEEEEEEEAEEPCTISLPPSETKATMKCPDVAEPEQPTALCSEPRVRPEVSSLVEVKDPIVEEEAEYEQELAEETGEFSSGVDQEEPDSSGSEEATLVEPPEDEIEADITDDTEEGVKACENGVNEEEKSDQYGVYLQNGTGKEYGDSSEESTPEKCTYIVNREETDEEEEDIQIEDAAENGEFSAGRRLLCVRALYDYQAEDENELSFEPGDIINDVETVDKAWWRGFSKDGRQGLFPANYVETI